MVGPNDMRHIVYACFHMAGHFFVDISYKTWTRKNT